MDSTNRQVLELNNSINPLSSNINIEILQDDLPTFSK